MQTYHVSHGANVHFLSSFEGGEKICVLGSLSTLAVILFTEPKHDHTPQSVFRAVVNQRKTDFTNSLQQLWKLSLRLTWQKKKKKNSSARYSQCQHYNKVCNINVLIKHTEKSSKAASQSNRVFEVSATLLLKEFNIFVSFQ